MKEYNKLVRDLIPNIIENSGHIPYIRILNDEEYLEYLNKKLIEEHHEYQEKYDINELADLEEVLLAIVKARGYTIEEFNEIRLAKQKANGSFEKRILLEKVE